MYSVRVSKADILLISIISTIVTYFHVFDFGIRMSTVMADDVLLTYSEVFKYPQHFEYDFWAKNGLNPALLSLINWLPAMMYKYLNFPPMVFAGLFVWLQNVLLAWAVYFLSILLTSSRSTAWLSVLFVMYSHPEFENLADYGGLLWMPYAGNLALPLILISIYFLLSEKYLRAILTAFLCGFIHPSLSSQGLFMVGIFFVFQSRLDFSILWRRGLVLGLLFGFWLIPYFLLKSSVAEIPSDELGKYLARNGHINPAFDRLLSPIVYILGVSIIAGIEIFKFGIQKKLKVAWISFLVGTLLLILVHRFALSVEHPALMRLLGTRSTSIFILFTIPIFINSLKKIIIQGAVIEKFMSCQVLFSAFKFSSMVYSPFVLILSLIPISQIPFGKLRFLRPLILATAVYLFAGYFFEYQHRVIKNSDKILFGCLFAVLAVLSFPTFFNRRFKVPLQLLILGELVVLLTILVFSLFGIEHLGAPNSINPFLVGFSSLVIVPLGLRLPMYYQLFSSHKMDLPFRKFATVLVGSVILLFTFERYYVDGRDHVNLKFKTFYEVQIWAKNNTKPGAHFYLQGKPRYHGWRALTGRASVNKSALNPYFMTKETVAYTNEFKEFFEKIKLLDPDSKASASCIECLSDEDLSNFLSKYKVDYIVVDASKEISKWRLVYSNNDFLVYKF